MKVKTICQVEREVDLNIIGARLFIHLRDESGDSASESDSRLIFF